MRPEIAPIPARKVNLAFPCARHQRCDKYGIPHHISIINVVSMLVIRIIHHQGPKRRNAFFQVTGKGRIQVRHETHSQFKQLTTCFLYPFIILHELPGLVLLTIDLQPRRVRDLPTVEQGHRREHNSLNTSDQILDRTGLPYLRRPQQS
ncbi:hypothetical protein D3C76_1246300 [compost metagenome]